tara:strand:+ start:867 stop:1205 length:339 start_codon:yes stop_codon:yes gene_type:complete
MSNLKISQQASEVAIQNFKNKELVKKSIALAFERTNTTVFNIENLIEDVLREFKHKDIELITKAIKNGSLGLYGKTYKLSTQEVCIWIREYQKELDKLEKSKSYANPYDGQY